MNSTYEIAFMFNQCFDILFISLSLLGVIFMSFKIAFDTKEDIRRKNRIDADNQRRIKSQKEHLTEIIDGISKKDAEELIQQLKNKDFDLFVIFKLPQYHLSLANTSIIHRVLDEVFESDVDDRYLVRWFDWWIKYYVVDVFIPVLEEVK